MAHELQIRINVHQTTVNFVLPLFFLCLPFFIVYFLLWGRRKRALNISENQ